MISRETRGKSLRIVRNAEWLLTILFVFVNAGCVGSTSSPGSPGGSAAPTVAVTSPASGATVSGTVAVTATASSSNGIASVQFQADGKNFGAAVTASPYTQQLNTSTLSNGTHSLTAVAKDKDNNSATSAAVSVTVNNSGRPTISITSPTSGATESGTITVTATASSSVGIASVQFQADGTNFGAAVTASPYSQSLNTTTLSNGTHSLTAVATDKNNNATTSAAVSITVNNNSISRPSVSITSPTSGATVSATVTVTATASSSGSTISKVQFLVDGANLGSADTTSPYQVAWDTTQQGNGTHTLSAQATDATGNTATSSNVSVTVSNQAGPPPPPTSDTITVTDSSGLGQTNRPISIARPFAEGEIENFAQASISGSTLLTQCDVKNRWPDGSLKFAVVSFVIPSIPAGGSVTVAFSNQASGNNTGFLAKADMLAANFNFDGNIQVSGNASHTISAKAILNAAASCADPGNDPDGGQSMCTYWLKGPVVTAVILEDRAGRSFDVNTDGGTGNPLHPIFEAWFYPQTNQVQLGYTLENTWASTTATNSARDESYSVTVTGGTTTTTTLFTSGSVKVTPRTAWHQTWCINGAGTDTRDECGPLVHVDNNWGYLATTKFYPHWDPSLAIASSKIASEVSGFATTNQTLAGTSKGVGFWPVGFDATGAGEPHGPLPTWDVIYLLSQCDAGNSTSAHCGNGSSGDMKSLVLRNADLGYEVPYFYREADANAGHGQHFDTAGQVATQGRVVSINARTQVNLLDTTVQGQCPTNFAADWINFGTGGQDFGAWDGNSLDTSHWPNLAYAAYLTTGQYAYYEEQLMQSAYGQGSGGLAQGSTRACVVAGDGALRQGSAGYWTVDQERANTWVAREVALGAFVAVDGSPEKAYLTNFVNVNVACWEGNNNLTLDVTGFDAAWQYCNTSRRNAYTIATGTTLGSWSEGADGSGGYQTNAPLNQTGLNAPLSANANFQNAYSTVTVGWLNDMGFCPGNCQLLQMVANRYLNMALNPAANIFNLADYVYPTLDNAGNQITSWAENQLMYASQPTGWPTCNTITIDESYGHEGMAATSYLTGITSSQGGYSGQAAYTKIRSSIGCINSGPTGNDFASGSPKWDITPRQ